MAHAPKRWTDDWIRGLAYAAESEKVYADPGLSRHRLVVKRHRKSFEVQAERPAQYGTAGKRKAFVVQIGKAPMMKVAAARDQATAILHAISLGKDVSAKARSRAARPDPGQATLASGWARFKTARERWPASPKTIESYEGAFKNQEPLHDVILRASSDGRCWSRTSTPA